MKKNKKLSLLVAVIEPYQELKGIFCTDLLKIVLKLCFIVFRAREKIKLLCCTPPCGTRHEKSIAMKICTDVYI